MAKLPWWVLLTAGAILAWLIGPIHVSSVFLVDVFGAHPWVRWIPAILVFGVFALAATVSFSGRSKRRRLLARHATLAQLQKMSWQDFERLVGEAYRRQGYRVRENGLGGADGGVDLFLSRGRKTFLVQCKRWRSQSIGAPIVREMWGLAHHHGANGVKVVTVGRFTAAARQFAKGKDLELVDGPALVEMISSLSGSTRVKQVSKGSAAPGSSAPLVSIGPPACPHCSARMVHRVARQDGAQFWGCPEYPRCRGTRKT